MPLEEAISTQRAIRRVKADPVDDDLVLHLIELALKAPTGGNAQNWEFIMVKDAQVKARLAALNRQAWRIYREISRRRAMPQADKSTLRMLEAADWLAEHLQEAPVLVVACLKGLIPPWPPFATTSLYASIFPSVQNLLLAARAAGLGALTTLPLWSRFLARRALGLPWNVTPCAVVPLGWPIGRYGPTRRRPVDEVVSLDRYGNRAFRSKQSPG
jgi:nitroreductase